MRVQIRGRGLEMTDALRNLTLSLLQVALDRVRDRIEGIEASVVDLNGPRGGIDKRCQLRAHLVQGGEVIARATDADSYAAVVRAVHRLRDRITRARTLRRKRDAVRMVEGLPAVLLRPSDEIQRW
jgi:ribosome-associated translation inhibitor RaiA